MGSRHMGGSSKKSGSSRGFNHLRPGGLSKNSGASDQLDNLGKGKGGYPRIIGHMKG